MYWKFSKVYAVDLNICGIPHTMLLRVVTVFQFYWWRRRQKWISYQAWTGLLSAGSTLRVSLVNFIEKEQGSEGLNVLFKVDTSGCQVELRSRPCGLASALPCTTLSPYKTVRALCNNSQVETDLIPIEGNPFCVSPKLMILKRA